MYENHRKIDENHRKQQQMNTNLFFKSQDPKVKDQCCSPNSLPHPPSLKKDRPCTKKHKKSAPPQAQARPRTPYITNLF